VSYFASVIAEPRVAVTFPSSCSLLQTRHLRGGALRLLFRSHKSLTIGMKMQSREQIRLSGLLQAQGPDGSSTAEATYWASAEVQS
jgi:hypothetical protein